jgi:hypothetical protein
MSASHAKEAATSSLVRPGLYFTCMKNNTTSEALRMAMPRATTVFR